MERVADEPGLPSQASERSYLAIGRDAPAWNAADHGKNAGVGRGGTYWCVTIHWTVEVAWGT